jgi:hypothetical protein
MKPVTIVALVTSPALVVALGILASRGARDQLDARYTILVTGTAGACQIGVYPDPVTGVRVKPGWKVGWELVNQCDSANTVDFTFTYLGDNSQKTPITFQGGGGTLIRGRVKSRFIVFCHGEEAPCGSYKYGVRVGETVLDPELEIEPPF